jgi:inner membrane transporter RhtA
MLGLAVLHPVVPFSLEFLALRRLTARAFGTLMSLEPAIALLAGVLILRQVPGAASAAGIILGVIAGVGATRTGARAPRHRRPPRQHARPPPLRHPGITLSSGGRSGPPAQTRRQ